MRAWRVQWSGLPKETSIVAALTRAAARMACVRGLKDAGWQAKFGDVRVWRAMEYDQWAEGLPPHRVGRCFGEEFVAKEIA